MRPAEADGRGSRNQPSATGRDRLETCTGSPGVSRTSWTSLGLCAIAGAAWIAWSTIDGPRARVSAWPATSAADALQQTLLEKNLGRPGDPDLGARFAAINARHFAGLLPPIPVIWEPGLSKVGELADRKFVLEGMFGTAGERSVILLNPNLAEDPAALDRALCHEMVHAYLHSIGDSTTTHGPSFQTVLRRLSLEDAFEGIVASDEERERLKAWLDTESARLDAERQALQQLDAEIQRERAEVERAVSDLNARIGQANVQRGGWPPDEDAAAVTAKRDAYNQRAIDANARVERHRLDHEYFNREVARYNLMLVYPDGVDQEQLVRPRGVPPRSGG